MSVNVIDRETYRDWTGARGSLWVCVCVSVWITCDVDVLLLAREDQFETCPDQSGRLACTREHLRVKTCACVRGLMVLRSHLNFKAPSGTRSCTFGYSNRSRINRASKPHVKSSLSLAHCKPSSCLFVLSTTGVIMEPRDGEHRPMHL